LLIPRIELCLLLQLADHVLFKMRGKIVHVEAPECVRACGRTARRRSNFPMTE
jgi:hypothetical protein